MSKNDIASTMNSIMSSPKYQAVFTKTAAKKEEKCPCKEKGDKCKDKCKDKDKGKDKGKGKDPKKKGLNPFQKCVAGLASISKTLDDAKFEKAATYAVLALDALVKQAEEECANCGTVPTDVLSVKDKPEKKEDEEDEDEDEEDEEEDTEKKDDEEEDEEDEKDEDEKDEEEDEDENDAWNWFGLKKDKQPAPGPSAQPAPPASNPQPTGWQPSQLAGAKGDPYGAGGVFDDRFESQLAGAEGDPMDPNLGDSSAVRDDVSMKTVLDMVKRIVQRERGGSPDVRAKMDEEGEYSALETDSTEPEIGDQRSREELYGVASKSVNSLIALAKELKGKTDPKAKVRNKSSAIFESTHSKVKDKKDHFPIDTAGRARNALARANQFDSAPEWWSGSIKELKNAVVKAVKAKYPSIKVTEKSKS
jgi:hypothetical protein